MSKFVKIAAALAGVTLALGMPPSSASTANAGTMTVTPRIAVTGNRTVALKPDGSLWAWGSAILGDGSIMKSLVPLQIGAGYAAIAAGEYHTAAVKSDGSLWAWGGNAYGQLGDGTTAASYVPKQIDTGYTAVAAGYYHTVALKSDGSLWAWGGNGTGQLGDGTTADSLVPKKIDTGYTAIAAGGFHTLGLKSDGSLWSWGFILDSNPFGPIFGSVHVPEQIGTGYSAIALGLSHAVALKTDGSLWAWGSNYKGQIGDGTVAASHLPKMIDTGYTAITAGHGYTQGIKVDGSLWAWGFNERGQLGDGTTIDSHVPKQIGIGYMMVAAGGSHTVALKSDGSLWAWGNGQLGDGTDSGSLIPRPISTGYTVPDGVAPSAPTGLVVIPAGATEVNIFWTTPVDNVGVTGYQIYRDGVLVGAASVTNYGDTGLTALTAYSYTVSACDASGNCSAPSASASTTTLAPRDIHLPTVPTGLTATAVSPTRIDLAWTASIDSVGVTQYKIFRGLDYPFSFTECVAAQSAACPTPGNMSLSGTPPLSTFSDTGLWPSTPYYYRVQACNAAGNCSAESETVSVMTQPAPTSRAAPTATGTASGLITNQTLTVTVAPPANVLDLWASIFVAAIAPSSMGSRIYALSANGGWIPFTACASAPATYSGRLGATLPLDVVPTPTDLSTLAGTSIHVGYGVGGTIAAACADMLDRATTVQAYTIK